MKDKIRALLALAADPGAAPQEAESAGRMAAKLMAKYQIDLGDLEEEALREEFDLTQAYARACRPGKKNPKVIPPWIGSIAWGVKIYTRTRLRSCPGGQILFQGPREDVELAVWLHELLLENAYKASNGSPQPNSFRNGYAGAIQSRLKAMCRQREQVDAEHTGTALVLVQGKREALMTEAFGPDTRGKSSKVSQSMEGRLAGAAAHIPTGRPLAHRSGALLNG
jgi:hypothetical protein